MSVSLTRKPIPEDVLAVLRLASVSDDLVVLHSGPLPFALYLRVNRVLNDLGGTWNRHRRGHVFPGDLDPGEALAAVTGLGLAPASNPLAHWPTPPAAADRVVEKAAVPHADVKAVRVLEPSAGTGALLEALARRKGTRHAVQAVELDPLRARRLADAGVACLEGDFLALEPGAFDRFDRIIMNPPFTSGESATAYVDHVLHALRFLKPGGVLASVCPAGFTFASRHKKLVNFRRLVERSGSVEPLPPKAFAAVGTSAACVIVTIKAED